MSSVHALYHYLEEKLQRLSKSEIVILEAELFVRICEELKEIIRSQNKEYFHLMKFSTEKENAMIDAHFIRCIINDILSTEEYNLKGLACYTDTPEDVIYEVACGNNIRPTLSLARKIIDIHRSVRPNLYRDILNKIISDEMNVDC